MICRKIYRLPFIIVILCLIVLFQLSAQQAVAGSTTMDLDALRPEFTQSTLTAFGVTSPLPCSIDYNVVSEDGGNFQVDVSITSATAIDGWELTWTFAEGQQIVGLFNANYTQDGNAVSVTNVAENAVIEPDTPLEAFGFFGSGGSLPIPTDFVLNGALCYEPPAETYFGGSKHTVIGSAEMSIISDTLQIANTGSSTESYGVEIGMGASDYGAVVFENVNTDETPDGATLQIAAVGSGKSLSALTLEVQENRVKTSADFSAFGLSTQRINIFSGNQLVAEADGNLAAIYIPPSGIQINPYRPMDDAIWALIDFPEPTEVILTDGTVAQGDRIAFIATETDIEPTPVSEIQLLAFQFPDFVIEAEAVGMFQLPHFADTQTALTAQDGTLTISPVGDGNETHVVTDLGRKGMVSSYSTQVDATAITNGSLSFGAHGPVDGVDNQLIFGAEITVDEEAVRLEANFDNITPASLKIAVLEQGVVIETLTGLAIDSYALATPANSRLAPIPPSRVELDCIGDDLSGLCARNPGLCNGGSDIANFGWGNGSQIFSIFTSSGEQISSVRGDEIAFIGEEITTPRGPFKAVDVTATNSPAGTRNAAEPWSLILLDESILVMPAPFDVEIYSAAMGGTGRNQWFNANIFPAPQAPVTYTWEATGQEPITFVRTTTDESFWSGNGGWQNWDNNDHVWSHFKWDDVGTKIVTMTITLPGFSRITTKTIEMVIPVAPEVTLTGPLVGEVDTSYVFTATVSPISATVPIYYQWYDTSWNLHDTYNGSELSHAVERSWETDGYHLLNVTVLNWFGWDQAFLLFDIPAETPILTPTIHTINSGEWNNPTTWDINRVPDETDVVLVQTNHQITVDSMIVVKSLINEGSIGSIATELAINASEAVVNNGYIGHADGLPNLPRNFKAHSSCLPGSGSTGFSFTIAPAFFANTGVLQAGNGAAGMPGGDITINSSSSFRNASTGTICAGHGGDDPSGTGGNGGTVIVFGAPIDNEGVISAGDGGGGAAAGGNGGELYIFGENTTNNGDIYAGDGGDTVDNISGAQAGDGGYAEVWGKYNTGSGFLFNSSSGTIQAGHGGDGNPSATTRQDAGCGGDLLIMAAPNVTLGGIQAAGLNGSPVAGGNSCSPGSVWIDPATITLFGENVEITGEDITIYGGDEWILALQDVGTDVFSATGDITLAVGAGGTIDLRGNRDPIFHAAGSVNIYADTLLADDGVPIQALAGNNVTVESGRTLYQLSAIAIDEHLETGQGAPVEIALQISNASPMTGTFDITQINQQDWSVDAIAPVTIPPLSGEIVTLTAYATEQANEFTITVALQGDAEVSTAVTVTTTPLAPTALTLSQFNQPLPVITLWHVIGLLGLMTMILIGSRWGMKMRGHRNVNT